jgi:hypothetical protein
VRGLDLLLDHDDEDGEGEVVLGAPAAVNGGLGHARAGGDAFDGQTLDAFFGQYLARGFEDRFFGFRAGLPAAMGYLSLHET